MKKAESSRKLGRPREFDADEALARALEVFWRQGYEGASLQDLTEAMGISRPSLYAAFGNKEALFRKVLDKYQQGACSLYTQALAEPTSRAAVERLLRGGANVNPANPAGCLMVQGALACGNDSDCVKQELINRRKAVQETLRVRFERAKEEGDLPPNSNPAVLSMFIATFMHGMAVQAASGATTEELQRIIDVLMTAWPSP